MWLGKQVSSYMQDLADPIPFLRRVSGWMVWEWKGYMPGKIIVRYEGSYSGSSLSEQGDWVATKRHSHKYPWPEVAFLPLNPHPTTPEHHRKYLLLLSGGSFVVIFNPKYPWINPFQATACIELPYLQSSINLKLRHLKRKDPRIKVIHTSCF